MRYIIIIYNLIIVFPIFSVMNFEKWYGGSSDDCAYSVKQTYDGCYIILGFTSSYGSGKSDFWLIKTDEYGNIKWDKTFGGIGNDVGFSVKQTKDGGYILTGYTESYGAGNRDVWLIKTDTIGNLLWEETFGDSFDNEAHSVIETYDGGYALTGYSAIVNDAFLWLIKTDSLGNKEWDEKSSAYSYPCGNCLVQNANGGYVICGTMERWYYCWPYWDNDILVKRRSSIGTWRMLLTWGIHAWNDHGQSIQITNDGGYIISGYTEERYGCGGGLWLLRTDSDGEIIWDKRFGDNHTDKGYSAKQTKDGGYIATGGTSYDLWIIKTDSLGNKQWEGTFGGGLNDMGHSIQQTQDGGYIVAGFTESFGAGNYDVYLIKIDSLYSHIQIENENTQFPTEEIQLKIYPNPFIEYSHILSSNDNIIRIYDITGKLIGDIKGEIIGKNLMAGIYILEAEGYKPTKIIKLR